MSTLHVPAQAQFTAVLDRAAQRAPDAFGDGYLRNLYAGQWRDVGDHSTMVTPVDGTETVALAKVGPEVGAEAVAAAADAHKAWATTPLPERIARVNAAV